AVALPASAAAAGCSVNYAVSSQWQGGFGANVTITNLGDPLTSWTLTWSFGAGQTVTQAWNTTLTQSGAAVTARNVSYNGNIPTNGSTSFGFNGSWTSSNPVPTNFAVNG
ncbi:arabinofuranosidase, partial [Micromonospora endophytica]